MAKHNMQSFVNLPQTAEINLVYNVNFLREKRCWDTNTGGQKNIKSPTGGPPRNLSFVSESSDEDNEHVSTRIKVLVAS